MTQSFITAAHVSVRQGSQLVLDDLSFIVGGQEHWALTGDAGVGKTTLAKALCGLGYYQGSIEVHYDADVAARPVALFVEQWYHFTDNAGLTSNFYYQQRYNNNSQAAATRTVYEELQQLFATPARAAEQIPPMLEQLGLAHRCDAALTLLSSGEHKKLQLAAAFLQRPQLLVLDNPYIGLDVATCNNLNVVFTQLVKEGVHVLLIGDARQFPDCITHVATLQRDAMTVEPRAAYVATHGAVKAVTIDAAAMPAHFGEVNEDVLSFDYAVQMEDVRVQYEDKVILDNIHWEVKRGDKWWLKGHNGAGKSTLLSLVVGDNPQAYANKIRLFDKRRGSGESIWDIKKKIGYISPELHWYFDQQTTCSDAIASGFFDTTGLYRVISAEQQAIVDQWLGFFELEKYRHKLLRDLSVGKQRMALLARALVKNPPVVILDEPCQGLDDEQVAYFIQVIDALMADGDRTLIYVNHRADQLPACIDKVLTLKNGRQVQIDLHEIKPFTVQL